MLRFRRPESLEVFDGQDPQGRRLSYEGQRRAFRRATLVVGPYGSGLANLVWMPPAPAALGCAAASAVLEFLADEGTSAAGVQVSPNLPRPTGRRRSCAHV